MGRAPCCFAFSLAERRGGHNYLQREQQLTNAGYLAQQRSYVGLSCIPIMSRTSIPAIILLLCLSLLTLHVGLGQAAPSRKIRCTTNAECLRRGLPLLRPYRRGRFPRAIPAGAYTCGSPTTVSFGTDQFPEGLYRLVVAGASGGNTTNPDVNSGRGRAGGLGRSLTGFRPFNVGDTLSIYPDCQGVGADHSGGGGGASWVILNNALLMVAGGGGGADYSNDGVNAQIAQTGTTNGAGQGTGGSDTIAATAGSDPFGAGDSGGSGAGFQVDGLGSAIDSSGQGGKQLSNGLAGGAASPFLPNSGVAVGGYGGGGGAGANVGA